MTWHYVYNLDLWPAIIALAVTVTIGIFSWRRRSVPGAKAFAIGCLFATFWVVGAILKIAAVDLPNMVFWLKFHSSWQLPTVVAVSCFFLQYAGLGRFLTRRNLILLSIPAIATMILIVTDSYHHLFWTEFILADHFIKKIGIASWFSIAYGNLLGVLNLGILIWLAIGSSHYRKPVALMLFGQVASRVLFLVESIYVGLFTPGESVLFVVGLSSAVYAFALFYYRVFDPVPLARSVVIQQMTDGMLVLDLNGRIVDINPTALEILAKPAANLCGKVVTDVLPDGAGMAIGPGKIELTWPEITLGAGEAARFFSLSLTHLMDRRGEVLGHLLLLHDITGQKRAQELLVEQQRTVATLQERDRLARELHDSIGQVLSFVSMQAQTAKKWAAAGNNDKAGPILDRLAEVAQDAHTDVRESILNLRTGTTLGWTFIRALRQYLDHYQSSFNIGTDLLLPEGLDENFLNPADGVQVLRVIQEAMTNVRKHSGARMVQVQFVLQEGQIRIEVRDDGRGFDPVQLQTDSEQHFGLQFMEERMAQIGGFVTIDSQPGAGTTVILEVPAGT